MQISAFTVVLILISSIGIGYAYDSTVTVDSDIGSSYCAIAGSVGGYPVKSISIAPHDLEESSSTFNLSFTSLGETQETLSLHYTHSKGTSLVLSITFVVSGIYSESMLTISCYGESGVVGSTSLLGTEEKNGTITGIILDFEPEKIEGKTDYHFKIDGVSSTNDSSIQMSFSVHPLEVSS